MKGQKPRTVGLLGMEVPSSSEDSDYVPSDREERAAPRRRSRRSTGENVARERPCTEAASSGSDELLADRLRRRTRATSEPDSEEDVPLRVLQTARRERGRKLGRIASLQQPARQDTRASGRDYSSLPVEVLRAIFLHSCRRSGGAIPTIPKLRCICRSWREAVEGSPEMWACIDMSFGWCRPRDADITRHTQSGAWAETEELVLSGCAQLTDRSLQRLADSCLLLRSLNLAYCTSFSSQGITQALAQMPRLASLNLSGIAVKPVRQTAADQIVKDVVTGPVGARLEELVADFCPHLTNTAVRAITGVQVGGAPSALAALRVLSLTASGSTYGRIALPIEDLQQTCPNLERLQVNGLGGMYGWQPGTAPRSNLQAGAGGSGSGPGFPRLVVAEVAACQSMMVSGTQNGTSYITDEALARLLHASERLEELNIAGTRVGAEGLLSIPEGAPLRLVVAARGSAASDEALEALATRFGSTLEEIDASQGGRHLTDHALCMLALCRPLKTLDVSGSAITSDGVRALLEQHGSQTPAGSSLASFALLSCRGVSRKIRSAAANGIAALRKEMAL